MNYDQNYYLTSCGNISYNDEHFKNFFENAADKIINTLQPTTVLDVGCAFGYLVTALRDKGVKAYGIDISEYAISQVRDDIKPYCRVCSGLEPLPPDFPEKYDLVTNIEVIEHLYEEDGMKLMQKLCYYSDKVLFSSTPDDITEKTHVNVQQHEYWAKNFAKNSFLKNLLYDASFISTNAFLFDKRDDVHITRVVEDYERFIRLVIKEKDDFIIQKDNLIAHKDLEIKDLIEKKELEAIRLQEKLEEALSEKRKVFEEVAHWESSYCAINNSTSWKLTKPLRTFVNGLKKILRTSKVTRKFYKGLAYLKYHGFRATYRRVLKKNTDESAFKRYYKSHVRSKKQLEEEKNAKFDKNIKISILVPLYNTPKDYLIDMIRSVQNQTYANWELCMADGSDEGHKYIETLCREKSKSDSRIKYKKLEHNLGISANTNECIEISTGDYIGLLDHDDILHSSVLYEVMRVICQKDADFIYTDEATFEGKMDNLVHIHFKPDYAPDTLRSLNYICHFTVFSSGLLNQAGTFQSEFDGSQDYDLFLRLTEKAEKIYHIPEVLYYWRSHSGSVASGIDAKTYAMDAAKKAIEEQLRRLDLKGTVVNSRIPTTYKIDYTIYGNPLISILIPNNDHISDLMRCIDSIIQNTSYENYEIVIIENNSTSEEIFNYYKRLENNYTNIRIITYKGEFNYSAINNFGFKHTNSEYILLLNNDTEVISRDWLQEMLMFAQRKDVGAVGAMLYYPDDTVQHAGVILGIGGIGGHSHKNYHRGAYGYTGRLTYVQNLSAVTAACMMISREAFEKVNGLDESFKVAFNDVDLCMKIRQAGYLIVFTPYAELYHCESKSRGSEDTPQKKKRFEGEVHRFLQRWSKELSNGDPYYNPNLSLESEDFLLK